MSKRSYSSFSFGSKGGLAGFNQRRDSMYPKKARKGPYAAKPAYKAKSPKDTLTAKVRALVAGKTKEVSIGAMTALTLATGTTISQCITDSSGPLVAGVSTSATALLEGSGDSALINSFHLRGEFRVLPVVHLDPTVTPLAAPRIRRVLVCFHKPAVGPSSAGTLPNISEVFGAASTINSLPIEKSANSGSFTILSDKLFTLGQNTLAVAATGAYPRMQDGTVIGFNEVLKINKRMSFKNEINGSGQNGGHYDVDVPEGQVTKNLLVLYYMMGSDQQAVTAVANGRIEYTL